MFAKVKEWAEVSHELLKEYLSVESTGEQAAKKESTSLNLDEHRYPSFTRLLPYQYFDEESKVFFNEHNAGLLYRIVPLTGANEKIAEQLDTLLRTKVSHDFTMQLLLVKHNQVGYEIDAFARQFSKAEFKNLSVLGDKLKTFYQNAAINGFKTNTTISPRLTHTEVFIVIDKVNKETESDLKACFGQFRVSFEASMTAAKIGFKRGDATDFLHLLNFYCANCPDSIYPRPVDYDQTRLLKEQALSHDFDAEVQNDTLIIRGVNEVRGAYETAVSVLTIDRLPAKFHLWDNINNTNNILHPEQSIPCNHIISVTYLVDEQGKAQGRANRKTRDLDKKSKSDYALHVAGTENQAHAWRTFRDDLSAQKTRSVKMLYNVVLFSRTHEKEHNVAAAISVYKYNGIELALCKRMQLPYFLVSMPFLFTGRLIKDFSLPTMMWPISSWNASQYMPILSDWSGVGKGIVTTYHAGTACLY